MVTVFGRTSPTHPYDAAISSLQRSKAAPKLAQAKNAIACNIRHDHRVSPEREQRFEIVCNRPRTGRQLQQAIASYFEKKIRTRKLPDFVYFRINGNNLISGHAKLATLLGSISPTINKDLKLVRILDVNGLRLPFQWLLDIGHRKPEWEDSFKQYYGILRGLPKGKEQRWVDCWLDRMLDASDRTRREKFIEALLDMLDCIRKQRAFQPTWATTWRAFEPNALTSSGDPNPDRWVQIMGMGKNPPEHWYIVLTYTVAEAGTLARPTQLDAGWYEYHFPSSVNTRLEIGGNPMDLRTSPAALVALPEYVHKQIQHPIEHWEDTARLLGSTTALVGRTTGWKAPSLTAMRQTHERLLISHGGVSGRSGCPDRNGILCVTI